MSHLDKQPMTSDEIAMELRDILELLMAPFVADSAATGLAMTWNRLDSATDRLERLMQRIRTKVV